jgi:hypothetical protein
MAVRNTEHQTFSRVSSSLEVLNNIKVNLKINTLNKFLGQCSFRKLLGRGPHYV